MASYSTTFNTPGNSLKPFALMALLSASGLASGAASDYAASPSQGTTSSPPQVMLAMPVDQQLFKRAYSDYTDLDGDGLIDTDYKDTFDYYGYFDANWCYQYDSAGHYYTPVSQATGTNGHHCTTSGAPWSGNFMNWVSMSRMDILRAILFGGTRSTDTTTQTILRKADSSINLSGSWAKVYSGSDIESYTPYSTTTSFCNLKSASQPSLRIAEGNYPRWATTEIEQCQWDRANSPPGSDELATHQLKIEVCVTGRDASNTERCKQYPDGNVKPIGILQRYGEEEQILFGLISGSYDRNDRGGVLRKNIRSITDELNLNNGIFNSSSRGIIYHISTFNLTSWRNPIAEIYLEAVRYFAGETSPTPDFSTTDSGRGLATETWSPSLNTDNVCASCAIILVSSGTNSFDRDDLDSSSDIPGFSGTGDLNNQTDQIGDVEYGGSFAGSYYHGGGNNRCTVKYLSNLSDATGICPDAPSRSGGYGIAGLSYHALTTDLRTDLEGLQNVRTYTIQLADSLPSLVVDVAGNFVSFQPLASTGSYRDLIVNSQAADGSSGDYTFIWEDCEEDCDNDFDAASRIRYCLGAACSPAIPSSRIKVEHRFESKITEGDYTFSYSIFGTDRDGIAPDASGPGGGDNQGNGPWHSETYNATGTTPGILPKPLHLAAKYGGFTDIDNDGTPNLDANGDGIDDGDTKEWDFRNNILGTLGADGIPDNFFLANNPSLLQTQLNLVLKDISSRISAGSSVALVSNSSSGAGSAIQGLFRPKITVNNLEISWVGLLHSLFVDTNGHLREDTNNNQTLDDYATDMAISLIFDPASKQTVIQRYTSSDNGATLTAQGGTVDLTELNPVWDAREQLMEVSDVISQRAYANSSSSGRHILTWRDNDNDGVVDSGEQIPFITSTFSGSNNGYLGVEAAEVDKLVKYLRGEDQTGYRSRSVDYDNDGDLDVWRLGDIIHSNPVSVASPKGFYSENKPFNGNDSTFINFQSHYQDRRQVVYVGSNDGMIHAFNAGFWDNDNNRFDLTKNGATSHPLGGELWAYAPMNLLPHLRYLSEPDYPHVYYMDGEPLIFDANIFTPDADHPDGWGTVLVMGMRLGGGAIDADINGTTRTMRSAFVMLDITNPETPPVLMAEITHPDLGFSTNRPVVIQRRLPTASGDYTTPVENNWYLAFGSGPKGTGLSGIRDALDDATSDQNMKVFLYDLNNNSFVPTFAPRDSGIANAYAGDMSIVDWNQDYYDDAIYFGSVETSGSFSGQLMRINLQGNTASNWSITPFTNPGRPISARPTAISNSDNEHWVFAGTGRELTRADSGSTDQEFFFGVKEPMTGNTFTNGTVSFSSLIDTTDVQVEASGALPSTFTVRTGTTVNSFDGLLSALKSETGWKNRLEHDGTDPSGKSISSTANVFALLLFTEYQPPAGLCEIDGTSFLQALHYQTGTAIPASVQQVLTQGNITDTTISTRKITLGTGLAPAPVIHREASGKTSIIIQGGAGNISSTDLEYTLIDDGRQSWRQIRNIPR